MKLGQGYVFTGVHDSVHGGSVRDCWGACVVAGGHVWLPEGHAWLRGACIVVRGRVVAGVCAWLLDGCVRLLGGVWLLMGMRGRGAYMAKCFTIDPKFCTHS